MASTARIAPDKPLQKGPNGRNLCRYCGEEVKPPRLTFCSEDCVHEFKIRRWPGYVRECVSKRDHGICAICGKDCRKLYSPSGPLHTWEADHIIPVVEGGGECGLENYRTLCIPCHKIVTAELAFRRSKAAQQPKQFELLEAGERQG